MIARSNSTALNPFQWILLFFAVVAARQPSPAVAESVLTNAHQVRALTPQEAARPHPVRLRGVVIGEAEPEGMAFVLKEETEGIYLLATNIIIPEVQRGDLVEAEGVSDPGGFAPFVKIRTVRKLGTGSIPQPQPVTFEQLVTGLLDAQWVEVSGIVRTCEPMFINEYAAPPPGTSVAGSSIVRVSQKIKMELATGGGKLAVQIDVKLAAETYVDAEVQIKGICFNQHNKNRQLLNPLLLLPRGVEVLVETPAPTNQFQTPPHSVASLMQFAPEGNYGHRVHVRGVVTHYQPGKFLWIRDNDRGLRITTSKETALQVGDEVDVLGFPNQGQYTPVLEDATFTIRKSGTPPVPVPLITSPAAVDHDADLVELEAVLGESKPTTDGSMLVLDWGGETVAALLRLPPKAFGAAEGMGEEQCGARDRHLCGEPRCHTTHQRHLAAAFIPNPVALAGRLESDPTASLVDPGENRLVVRGRHRRIAPDRGRRHVACAPAVARAGNAAGDGRSGILRHHHGTQSHGAGNSRHLGAGTGRHFGSTGAGQRRGLPGCGITVTASQHRASTRAQQLGRGAQFHLEHAFASVGNRRFGRRTGRHLATTLRRHRCRR